MADVADTGPFIARFPASISRDYGEESLALLERHEWVWGGSSDEPMRCPECGGHAAGPERHPLHCMIGGRDGDVDCRSKGHVPDCRLAAHLAALRVALGKE